MLDRDVRRRITVDEALQHPWLAMHAAGAAQRECECPADVQAANNIVTFAGAPAKVKAVQQSVDDGPSALGIWAMMQAAVCGQPSVM